MHRAGKHHPKLVVGELKHIREPLLDRQFPGAKDLLPVNIRLQRFQRARGAVRIAVVHPGTLSEAEHGTCFGITVFELMKTE